MWSPWWGFKVCIIAVITLLYFIDGVWSFLIDPFSPKSSRGKNRHPHLRDGETGTGTEVIKQQSDLRGGIGTATEALRARPDGIQFTLNGNSHCYRRPGN